MAQLAVLGIMSGTSIDGVDFVLCHVQRRGRDTILVANRDQARSSFPKPLAQKLRRAAQHLSTVDELALLHHELGQFYARQALKHKRTRRWHVDLVGLHGQTVFHQTPQATLQIGEASYLRVAMDCPVACDFRVMDLALGGEGAPLAPLFHAVAFASLAKRHAVAVQNLGGIGNVTYLSPRKQLAFDTGPANMLIDMGVRALSGRAYDRGGAWAARGQAHTELIKQWLKHPYLRHKPPKSCGREEFGEAFFKQAQMDFQSLSVNDPADQIATLTEYTVQATVQAYRRFLPQMPKTVVLCGGGAKNTYLRKRLSQELAASQIVTSEQLGWPSSSIEGAAFALLAARCFWRIPSDTRAFTGAERAAILGKLL